MIYKFEWGDYSKKRNNHAWFGQSYLTREPQSNLGTGISSRLIALMRSQCVPRPLPLHQTVPLNFNKHALRAPLHQTYILPPLHQAS